MVSVESTSKPHRALLADLSIHLTETKLAIGKAASPRELLSAKVAVSRLLHLSPPEVFSWDLQPLF